MLQSQLSGVLPTTIFCLPFSDIYVLGCIKCRHPNRSRRRVQVAFFIHHNLLLLRRLLFVYHRGRQAQPLSHAQRLAFPAPRNIVKQPEAQDRSFGGEKSGSIGLRIDDPPKTMRPNPSCHRLTVLTPRTPQSPFHNSMM